MSVLRGEPHLKRCRCQRSDVKNVAMKSLTRNDCGASIAITSKEGRKNGNATCATVFSTECVGVDSDMVEVDAVRV